EGAQQRPYGPHDVGRHGEGAAHDAVALGPDELGHRHAAQDGHQPVGDAVDDGKQDQAVDVADAHGEHRHGDREGEVDQGAELDGGDVVLAGHQQHAAHHLHRPYESDDRHHHADLDMAFGEQRDQVEAHGGESEAV